MQYQYSRYPVVDFITTTSAKATIPKLDCIFSDFGIPDQVDSDNEFPFQSDEFSVYIAVCRNKVSQNHPSLAIGQSIGDVHEEHKSLLQTANSEWLNYKQLCVRIGQLSHPSTNKSPANLMFNGRYANVRQDSSNSR